MHNTHPPLPTTATRHRTRMLLTILITLTVLLYPRLGERTTSAQPGPALEVVNLVNQYRAARGLNTLATHPALMAAAQTHVDWMVETGSYGHTGPGGSTPGDRAAAAGYPTNGWYVYENWVGGGGMTPTAAIEWWDASPIHHQTLNLEGFEHIGVGYTPGGIGGVFVLLIAKPSPPPDPTPKPGQPAGPTPTPGPPTPTPFYVEPLVLATPDADGTIIHVIGVGQTAWDIAAVYGVDLNEMLDLNRLTRPVVLHPGDSVIVKLGPNATPPQLGPQTHVVQDGESAWTVAAIYGLTLDDLLIINGLQRPAILQPGDVLIVQYPDNYATVTPVPPSP